MKKIINEWRKFISESSDDLEQVRISLGKKMNSVLFRSLDPFKNPEEYSDFGPDILRKYKYLYSAIYGTKAERERGEKPYRPEMGYKFVEQKVNLFIKGLTEVEKSVLKNDIPQLVSLLKKGDVPKFSVQLPVEKTGHAGIDPSFAVPMTGRASIDDWGMGGSIKDTSGENYIFHILDLISNKLPSSGPVTKVSDQEIRSLYFMSETKAEFDTRTAPEPEGKPSRFAHAASIDPDFLAMMNAKLRNK